MVKLDMLLDIFAFSVNLRLAVSINKRVALFVTDGYTSGRTKSGSCSSACIICLCDNGFLRRCIKDTQMRVAISLDVDPVEESIALRIKSAQLTRIIRREA